jgi:transcriptional regulator with XRE-family HTH domain
VNEREGISRGETVGERLRRLRLARGLSQRQLAAEGISAAFISRIEAGSRRPSVRAIRLLARKLRVSPDYLETGRQLGEGNERELKLADAELALRFAENSAEAERTFRAVLEEAERSGDLTLVARARFGLGLAAFQRGDHPRAIRELEAARSKGTVGPLSQPDLFATLGRAYVSAGYAHQAVELFRACLVELEEKEPANASAQIRFSTYLSYALSDMGELARAQEVLQQVLERADVLVDSYSRIRLHWAQARLASAGDEPAEALEHLRRAIVLLEATDDRRHLGRAHLLSAEILTLQDDIETAEAHLETAAALLGGHPDAEDEYWLRVEQARLAARSGRAEDAVALAREALVLIGETDAAERGTAYWALGEGLFGLGDNEGGSDAFSQAVELLSRERLWHEAVGACRAWARLLRQTGRASEAFEVLERATLITAKSPPGRVRARANR